MRIWHTKTQEEYDFLMKKLEKEDCKWNDGDSPTEGNVWNHYKEKTCIELVDNRLFYTCVECSGIGVEPVIIF